MRLHSHVSIQDLITICTKDCYDGSVEKFDKTGKD